MAARTRRQIWAGLTLVAAMTLAAAPQPRPSRSDPGVLQLRSGPAVVTVERAPFGLRVEQAGEVVLETVPIARDGSGYGPLGFALGTAASVHQLGYAEHVDADVAWFHATSVVDAQQTRDRLRLTVATDAPDGRRWDVDLQARPGGRIAMSAALSDTTAVVGTSAAFTTDARQRFLGFGERSDRADQTGHDVVTWNEEGPFSAGDLAPVTDPLFGDRWQGPGFFPGSNFTMPWFLSSRGYGFLLDSDWLNGFELATQRPDAWRVTTREPALRWTLYAGPTPAGALERFTADTGRQPEPAAWFFGPWVQPGPGASWWREQDVPITVAQTYAHYLPCAAQHGRRDALRADAADWHAHGVKVTTYVNSFVCQGHPDGAWDRGDERGWFLRHAATGTTYPVPYVAYVEPDGLHHGVVDFTDRDATTFWQDLVREAIEDGYDGWMEDFGEYVPVDSVTSDGRSGAEYHNRYCTDYHAASHDLTWPLKGTDFAQFVRCGYTGTAPFARIVWGADPSEDFSGADGLAAAVSQALSMGASGIAYWGSDIGGFHALVHSERTDAELQTRWLQFGAFSGIMRTQRTGYPRPGPDTYLNDRAEVFGDEVLPVWQRYARLRTQLFPYVWEAAQRYQQDGTPIMRHMALVAPDDPMSWDPVAEYQFLFGDDLLVAPVVEDGARTRTVYLPEGDWVELWQVTDYDAATGSFRRNGEAARVRAGGRVVTVDAPLDEIPVFVRHGACLPMLPETVNTLADVGLDMPGVTGHVEVAARHQLCAT